MNLLVLVLVLVFGDDPQRTYHLVPLAQVPKRQFTYLETCGFVTYVKYMQPKSEGCPSCDGDGDWHVTFECPRCPKRVLVAEIMPEIPFPPPEKGHWYRVPGLRHFDDWHNWYELHPVLGPWVEDPFCEVFDFERKKGRRK